MRAGKTYGCLQYSKSTIFQANHNVLWQFQRLIIVVCNTAKVRFFKQITTKMPPSVDGVYVVCNTAKVRFFKQITTCSLDLNKIAPLFAILQKYDFSSKSQQ